MEYSAELEQEIIPKIRNGNEEAYRMVFYRYYDSLCHYAMNFIRDKGKAEDLVQEVFLKLWTKRESLKTGSSLKAYLYKMTYHEFVTVFRKEKRYQQELDIFKFEALSPIIQESEESWQLKLKRVKEAIDSLPPRCKEIFILNKKHGLKHKEIAEQLSISVKTVENQVGKALKALRKKLAEETLQVLIFIRRLFRER